MATWLVTGTNRGLGLEFCKLLLARGEVVIGACRNPEGARDHWELAADYKDRFRSIAIDIASPASIAKAAEELKGQAIDCLINNAGVLKGDGESLKNLNFADVEKSFQINTLGPMRVTQVFLPNLEQSLHPKVVHITSKMGSIADNTSGGYYAYRMSKAALNMFHMSFKSEFPKIATLAMHPGWVQTDMGGKNAPLSIHDSVAGMLNVISDLTLEKSGKFLDYSGAELKW